MFPMFEERKEQTWRRPFRFSCSSLVIILSVCLLIMAAETKFSKLSFLRLQSDQFVIMFFRLRLQSY